MHIARLQFEVRLDRFGPTSGQHDQLAPTWAPLAPGISGNPMVHAEYSLLPMFFCLRKGVRARLCSPHWACPGPNLGGRCPPSCQLGSGWAQVGSCLARLRPRMAKFDPVGFGWATSPRVPNYHAPQLRYALPLCVCPWLFFAFAVHVAAPL